ncbi:MAG: hypothetical protein RBT63_08320 [Bdellovibrionales bacterium]|jgi:hypothetical protein|nr:hypothetical protein [Bdellovibrionales bacterium]
MELDVEVAFVRRRPFTAVLEGIPGEWSLEAAVLGIPDPESGMVLNLIEMDRLLDQLLTVIASKDEIRDVQALLREMRVSFQGELAKLQAVEKNKTVAPKLERLTISDTTYFWS